MSDPRKQALVVLQRDRHTCQLCGLDCRGLERAYYLAIAEAQAEHARNLQCVVTTQRGIEVGLALQGELRAINQRLRDLGFTPGKSFYEVDHVIPLIEGGTNDLSNLRCLCAPCHRAETKILAARRARKPLKAWAPPRVDRLGRPV